VHAIGFVVALPAEARSVTRRRPGFDSLIRLPDGHWLTVSGAGPARAHAAALRLTEQKVSALVSWGCAAALAGHLQPGHLVLPERILGEQGDEHRIDGDWRERLAIRLPGKVMHLGGALIESSRVVSSRTEKLALHARTGGMALDMESAAVARAASHHNLPFLIVRAIADPAHLDFPEAVSLSLNPRGDVRMTQLLGHLARRPGQIGELLALGRAFGAALDTLHRVRRAAGQDFGFLPPAGGSPA
jgi:adenosylhomocysteine nucleosidase